MKRIVMGLFILLAAAAPAFAKPLTSYNYISDHEVTRFREIIWFWSPDTFYGHVHSNDFIGLKYSPHFYGIVSTSQRHFLEYQASPHFEHDPIFNAPPVEFPEEYPHLIEQADLTIRSWNNQMITWIELRDEDGVNIYQYPRGTPRMDSLILRFNPFERSIVRVLGDVEVEGALQGQLTIYAQGDIGLIDNCLYEGASDRTARFDEDETDHFLALVSDRDVIIKNTRPNGREDGYNEAPDDYDRHSIMINGSIIALNGSFRIEHQNDDWELYQGPEPDERGYLYLKGSLAQRRRGYVARSNHRGTGYECGRHAYRYDFRLDRTGPPGFAPGEYPIVEGRHENLRLNVNSEYTFRNAVVNNLTVDPGITLKLDGFRPIVARGRVRLNGTEDRPIIVEYDDPAGLTIFRIERGVRGACKLNHVEFQPFVSLEADHDSIFINNCVFTETVSLSGYVSADSNWFAGDVAFTGYSAIAVNRNIFENGLSISGHLRSGGIINNTIAGGRRHGILLRRFDSIQIRNNIITGNQYGIANEYYNDPVLAYNCVYGNRGDDYVDCEPGEGSISEDPLLRTSQELRYRLRERSPCIDSGDPESPLDPDGSRADMGAFYYSHELGVQKETTAPERFSVLAHPNPFNDRITLQISSSGAGGVSVKIYSIDGRMIFSRRLEFPCGTIRYAVSGEVFKSSGLYIVRFNDGMEKRALKLFYLQ